jgi:hypothetical protein
VGRPMPTRIGAGTLIVIVGAILSTPAEPASTLQGTFRVTLAPLELRALGTAGEDVAHDVGTWTLTIAGGRWTLRQVDGLNGDAFDRGLVRVEGSRAAFTLTSADGYPHGEFVAALRWRTTAGRLRFAALDRRPLTDLVALLTARPWKRLR